MAMPCRAHALVVPPVRCHASTALHHGMRGGMPHHAMPRHTTPDSTSRRAAPPHMLARARARQYKDGGNVEAPLLRVYSRHDTHIGPSVGIQALWDDITGYTFEWYAPQGPSVIALRHSLES